MAGVALYRKWRPLKFSDVWGQGHITRALQTQVGAGRVSHAYLFTGTRGTGKTTCAKILARAANCLAPEGGDPCNICANCAASLAEAALDISEIDAASNNGVDNIREMREEAFLAPTSLKYRVYIIDEVHMLSVGAFNALLKILEEPPAHVIFILATTELHKVPATVLSRCQRYDFRRIAPETVAGLLEKIASGEGAALLPEAAGLLAKLGDGSMRDAISLLDRCMDGGEISAEKVAQALGLAPFEAVSALLDAVADGDAARAVDIFGQCYADGRDIVSLMDELLSLLRDAYVAKAAGGAAVSPRGGFDAVNFAKKCDCALLEYLTSCLCDLLRRFTRTAIRRADAEMCILRMCLRSGGQAEQVPAAPQRAAAAGPVPAKPASAQADDLPWHAADKQAAPEKPPSAKKAAPERTPAPAASAGAGGELAALVSAVGQSVNSAVRTYLSLAECENIDNTLHIYVAEESLGFMQKPAVLEAFNQAAEGLGHAGVNIHGPRNTAGAAPGAKDILSRARSLGVNVKSGN